MMIKACTFINLCKLQFVAKRPISIIYRTYTAGKEMFFTQRQMFYWEKITAKKHNQRVFIMMYPKRKEERKTLLSILVIIKIYDNTNTITHLHTLKKNNILHLHKNLQTLTNTSKHLHKMIE